MTEVGVSLALRRHRNLIGSKGGESRRASMKKSSSYSKKQEEEQKSQQQQQPKQRERERRRSSRSRRRGSSSTGGSVGSDEKCSRILGKSPASYSSWQTLVEGAALYGFCMILPSLLRSVVRWYISSWESDGIFYQMTGYGCSLSWLSMLRLCQKYLPKKDTSSAIDGSVLAPDAGISDVAIVVVLSLSMAVIRLALVHFLVPNYKQPKRLAALVRCKSIHLLSSQYPGSLTPTTSVSHKLKNLDKTALLLPGLHLPNLHGENEEDSVCGDGSNHDFDHDHPTSPLFHTPRDNLAEPTGFEHDSNRDVDHSSDWLFHDDDQDEKSAWGLAYDDDDDDDNQNPAPAVSSGLLTHSSAQNLQALLQQAVPQVSSRRGSLARKDSARSVNEPPDRVFAAPKYATAVFRLMFCLFSCLVGIFYFGGADFVS
jgi:hypothetical protein